MSDKFNVTKCCLYRLSKIIENAITLCENVQKWVKSLVRIDSKNYWFFILKNLECMTSKRFWCEMSPNGTLMSILCLAVNRYYLHDINSDYITFLYSHYLRFL